MRFIVDVSQNEDKIEIEISASVASTQAAHHQLVEPEKVGESIGTVIQRILERPREAPSPEGKKMVSVGISWIGLSIVDVAVPVDVEHDGLREAIRLAIKSDGLPECVVNSTLEFISPLNAYAPPKEGPFVIGPESEIDID